MSPKLIAKIMRMAIKPSARVAPISSDVLCELLDSYWGPDENFVLVNGN